MVFEEGLFDRIRPSEEYILLFVDESNDNYVGDEGGAGDNWSSDSSYYVSQYNGSGMPKVFVLWHNAWGDSGPSQLASGSVPNVQYVFMGSFISAQSVVSVLPGLGVPLAASTKLAITYDSSGSYSSGVPGGDISLFASNTDDALTEARASIQSSFIDSGERWLRWAVSNARTLGYTED